jgi:hypothetical protein
MSYRITIKANAGTTAVTVEGDLPDGEHIITGNDTGAVVHIEVERRSELGRYVIRAKHDHDMHELAQVVNTPRSTTSSAPPDDADR